MSVVVILADGARPDTLDSAINRQRLPALSRLRDEGAMHTITTVFPSVTGPAYAPFLMGRFPGPVGLPGLRWYDRERRTSPFSRHTRSYVGPQMRLVDRDLDPSAPTIFEMVPSSLAALNVIGRGLPVSDRLGRGLRFVARTARTHFSGKVRGWLAIDRDIAADVADQIRKRKPDFVFAALTGIDKMSHSRGHDSSRVEDAMAIVDSLVAEIRADAERQNTWESMHLWVVSDHGHSRVDQHEDLVRTVSTAGFRTMAHPFVYSARPEVAVMVSGNAMAHIYLDLERRIRPFVHELPARWRAVGDALLGRESVDLMIVPFEPGRCEVHGRRRGRASMHWERDCVSYRPITGDPLGIGEVSRLDPEAAYDRTIASDYPDSLVQIANLSDSPRSGEIILSAARGWDFRARFEPIPHRSSHGALHRDHMLVPLLTNRPVAGHPRRTVDVMPSALAALGITPPGNLDGSSFV